jgi:hypothetical protein
MRVSEKKFDLARLETGNWELERTVFKLYVCRAHVEDKVFIP